jgi:hypothetical protein
VEVATAIAMAVRNSNRSVFRCRGDPAREVIADRECRQ